MHQLALRMRVDILRFSQCSAQRYTLLDITASCSQTFKDMSGGMQGICSLIQSLDVNMIRTRPFARMSSSQESTHNMVAKSLYTTV